MRYVFAAIAIAAAAPAPALAQAQTSTPAPTPAPSGSAPAAQSQTPPPGAEAVQQAAQAFGQCIATAVGADTTTDPDTLAGRAVTTCQPQLTALQSGVDTLISGLSISDAEKTTARTQARERFANVRTEIAGGIRQRRAAPAPAATPTPAPAPTPQN